MANVYLVATQDEPDPSKESILAKGDSPNREPFFIGGGDVKLRCGNCKFVLCRDIANAVLVSALVLHCPECGWYNRTRT